MKVKAIISTMLLLFIGISVAYLVVSEIHQDRIASESSNAAPNLDVQAPKLTEKETGDVSKRDNKVIAYYFHGTRRCPTCLAIEAYTEEALRTGLPEELENRKLIWQAVNVMKPENEHFIRDYNLSTRSVVLVDVRNGKEKRWKNLTRVWELVRDKPQFLTYIHEETQNFLQEQQS